MTRQYTDPETHGEIWGWIERVGQWVMVGRYEGRDAPTRRKPGTVIGAPHRRACMSQCPPRRPRRPYTGNVVVIAQEEVRNDAEVAARVETEWREYGNIKWDATGRQIYPT